jgi:hypothetical protein
MISCSLITIITGVARFYSQWYSQDFWYPQQGLTVYTPNSNYEFKKKSQVFIEFHLIGLDYIKMFECKKKVNK